MRRDLQLSVSKPCHENWDDMRPADKGRYCGSCSKIVVDFSVMSDQEVLNYLGNPGAGLCGRFAPDQLERDFALVSPVQKKKGWVAWNFLLGGVSRGIRSGAGLAPMDSVKYTVLPDVVLVGYGTTKCTRITGAYSTVMGEMQTTRIDTLNAAGALIQQRWMEVGSSSQVDLFGIPAGLAAGTYFFRAVREGSDKRITRKIVVI